MGELLFEEEWVEVACVIGIPHAIYGEDIVAVLKLKEGTSFENVKQNLHVCCETRLSAIQKPSLFLEIDDFPRTVTGKIHKEKLKQLVKIKLSL